MLSHRYLGDDSPKPRALLLGLSRAIEPDGVPYQLGTDPWLKAIEQSNDDHLDALSLFLRAYLLCRALGPRSLNPGELAQYGFEATHAAAAENRLPSDAWHVLAPRLPLAAWWSDWDKCARIRSAVVDLFVRRSLSAECFVHLTTDDHLFLALADTASRSNRGWHFLKQTLRSLEKKPTSANERRGALLESALRQGRTT